MKFFDWLFARDIEEKVPKDFGCGNHIWIESNHSKDAQCLNCGLASWNSITFKPSEIITREEWRDKSR